MSSMFGGGFKATKCKTLLRLAMARIKLLRNKRDIQIKQMRKDIAQLLSTGQEPSARIRVEHIAREQNIMAAYDILELFCELIIVRLPIIESQKVCPMDLKEAVCSLIFASPRCADLPELLQIRGLFTSKYGKEFVAAAAELRPECGVNRRIIEKLSVRAPSGQIKLKLLTEIAAEHNVTWDPADSEAELMKQPEDLLDGHKKFFGANEGQETSSPKQEQRAPTVPPAPAPAPPAPAAGREPSPITMKPLPVYSSESEEDDTPSGEKKQFIPFVSPVPPKGIPAGKGINPSTKGSSSTASSIKGDPRTQTRKEGPVDYEQHGNYDNVAAAAKAAAESADRAVAAARAAAELAKTHPSKREPLPRSASKDVELSSSEEESEEEEDLMESEGTSGRRNVIERPGANISLAKTNDLESYQQKPDESFRSKFDESLRRSNSEDYDEGSYGGKKQDVEPNTFSKTSYAEEKPEKDLNPGRKFDSEQDSFWRSGDQEWVQPANFAPEKKFDSGGFYPDEQESLYRRDADLFKVSQSDELYSSRPQDKEPNGSTSKLFSSTDSSRNLFTRSFSEEKDIRSSDETPFYDSKPGFATPKFDDEEEEIPYRKPATLTTDLYSKRDFENQRSNFHSPKAKPSFKEFWQSSSFSFAGEEAGTPKIYGGDYHLEEQHSDSYRFDTQVSDSQSLPRVGSDPVSTKSFYKDDESESLKQENPSEYSPIPKSRRTRKTSKSKESLEGAGGSGGSGGLPPSGRTSKYFSSENVESARSPEFYSPVEPDNLSAHSFDDSPNFPPKTSLLFYNSTSASTPPERTPPSVSSAYESPDTFRDSSPSVRAGSTSPGLERRDSPSAPAIHPKLPDYDDLTARFEALKGKGKR